MGRLNGILAQVGGNLNNNFQESQMPGGCPGGGMLKLRLDRYISFINYKVGDDNKKSVKIMQVRVVIMLQYISSEISKRPDGRKLFIFSK